MKLNAGATKIHDMAAIRYLCIIGDLVDSRSFANRSDFQQKLKKTITEVNRRNHAASPWTLTLGDEFQAVFQSENGVWDDVLSLMMVAWPHRIRFSLAVGGLDTAINSRQALGMDGPAFHLARSGIETLKANGGFIELKAEHASADSIRALCVIASLTGKLIYQARTDTRLKVFRGMLAGRKRKDIARTSKISASAVSQQIETAALEELLEGAQLIEAFWHEQISTSVH